MRQGIRGLASSSFFDNVPAKYHDNGDAISNSTTETDYNLGGTPKMGYITTDIYTSFVLLIGIFFPSCTGRNLLTNVALLALLFFENAVHKYTNKSKMQSKWYVELNQLTLIQRNCMYCYKLSCEQTTISCWAINWSYFFVFSLCHCCTHWPRAFTGLVGMIKGVLILAKATGNLRLLASCSK